MPCGHPLAARRIVWSKAGKRLITDCWACAIEKQLKTKKAAA